MDETYQTYLNRVARLTLPETYKTQLQHIQESPKFKLLPNGSAEAVPFPGYTVCTPTWEEVSSLNSEFYNCMLDIQQQLAEQLDPGLMITVPPESFHLTLADLIWDSAYRAVEQENPHFEKQLQECIQESFKKYPSSLSIGKPIEWQILGLMIRPRAIAVCLAPKDENSYRRMLELRRCIYQNSSLMALGIEQQYHFTSHITLGYFGKIASDLDRDRLTQTLLHFNREVLPMELIALYVQQAQLRKFDDMMRYYRQPDWPVLQF
ncbi:MAG: DUF1868 domain-containing protein [Coleofasciculaceae cyanobacterium]